jgi:hypothetical protein
MEKTKYLFETLEVTNDKCSFDGHVEDKLNDGWELINCSVNSVYVQEMTDVIFFAFMKKEIKK